MNRSATPENERRTGGARELRDPPQMPLRWIFWLSAVVIIMVLAASISAMFAIDFPLLAKYRITLALICFALSTISGLLFASRVEVTGRLGLLSVTIVGPAALWLAALGLVTYIYPEERFMDVTPLTLDRFGQIIRDTEAKEGWIGYGEWKQGLEDLIEPFRRDEERQLELILTTAFYEGSGRPKLTNPEIQAVFAYLPKHLVAFRRLRGANPGAADIYFRAASSTGSEPPKSVLLFRDKRQLTASFTGEDAATTWQPALTNPVDCLIVALYDATPRGVDLKHGDLVAVDLTKYAGDGARSTIELGILSVAGVEQLTLWSVRGSRTRTFREVPVVFKKHPLEPREKMDSLTSGIAPWLELIDRALDDASTGSALSAKGLEFLRRVQALLPAKKFAGLLDNGVFKGKQYVRAEGLRDSVVAQFWWAGKP